MSMPSFVFYFRCDTCDANSDDYSIFPFHDLIRPDITLPAWSGLHKCWSQIQLALSAEQRKELESDPQNMIDFAASLSTESLTVCVPQLQSENCDCAVSVTPEAICPSCGGRSRTIFGYPPREELLSVAEIPSEELNAAPISAIELSARSRNICSALGIRTLGQLREKRDTFISHKRTTDSSVAEIDRWLAVGQSSDKATYQSHAPERPSGASSEIHIAGGRPVMWVVAAAGCSVRKLTMQPWLIAAQYN